MKGLGAIRVEGLGFSEGEGEGFGGLSLFRNSEGVVRP